MVSMVHCFGSLAIHFQKHQESICHLYYSLWITIWYIQPFLNAEGMNYKENSLKCKCRWHRSKLVPSYPTSECKMWTLSLKNALLVALVALVVASKWRSSLSQACSLRKGTEVAGAAFTHFPLLFLFGQKLKRVWVLITDTDPFLAL